jgi:hypothetical protein
VWLQVKEDADIMAYLHTLKRWNTVFVPCDQVLWWHAEEWSCLQEKIRSALHDRLVKVTARASAQIEGKANQVLQFASCFYLSANTPIDILLDEGEI